jgi:hypothetical protein
MRIRSSRLNISRPGDADRATSAVIMARVMGHTKVDTTINTYAQVL